MPHIQEMPREVSELIAAGEVVERPASVVKELVENALDAMPDGGTLTLGCTVEKQHLVLSVTDTGQGIAPENLNHIFDPYFTTKGQGTGLGLATVHKIMEAHGGSISVTSEPGQGAVFRLLLPLGGEGGKVHGHE